MVFNWWYYLIFSFENKYNVIKNNEINYFLK